MSAASPCRAASDAQPFLGLEMTTKYGPWHGPIKLWRHCLIHAGYCVPSAFTHISVFDFSLYLCCHVVYCRLRCVPHFILSGLADLQPSGLFHPFAQDSFTWRLGRPDGSYRFRRMFLASTYWGPVFSLPISIEALISSRPAHPTCDISVTRNDYLVHFGCKWIYFRRYSVFVTSNYNWSFYSSCLLYTFIYSPSSSPTHTEKCQIVSGTTRWAKQSIAGRNFYIRHHVFYHDSNTVEIMEFVLAGKAPGMSSWLLTAI
jgi:hypothetical protein